MRDSFLEIMRGYHADGVVYQSSERGALYRVEAVDDFRCRVARLSANEAVRCSQSVYLRRLAALRSQGGSMPFTDFDGTAAKRCTFLQGVELGLSPNRRNVLDLSDADAATQNLCEIVSGMRHGGSTEAPKLYKPALISVVIDGIESGELTENRITFDWLVPKCIEKLASLGQHVGEKQIAYAFYHLTSDLIWMLAYHNPLSPFSGTPSPSDIRSRVRFALLKDTYWRVLQDAAARSTLNETLATNWWTRGAQMEIAELKAAFDRFRAAPVERMRVLVRRHRSAQIRELLRDPEKVDVRFFNREVWNIETETRLDGRDIQGRIYSDQLTAEEISDLTQAVSEDRLELHGNYVWRSATSVYGTRLRLSEQEQTDRVRQAVQILNSSQSVAVKSEQIGAIPGFGPNITTGLVMMFHPKEWALWNGPSRKAMKLLGNPVHSSEHFQESTARLRRELAADDFLELDWFLYQIANDKISIAREDRPLIDAERKYWAIAPGQGARQWKPNLEEGVITIGWNRLGDLRQYASKDEIEQAISENSDGTTRPTNATLACWEFVHSMRIGDYVIAKRGRSTILGLGVVESEYEHDPERSEHHNFRRVRWLSEGKWQLPKSSQLPVKTLTDVSGYRSFLDFALAKLRIQEVNATAAPPEVRGTPSYTVDDALDGLFLSKEEFQATVDALARKRNVILQGPPGVGKTFMAKRLAYALIGYRDVSHVEMVQFHQSYAYEDFIQGYRPREDGGFELRNGVFYEFCRRAQDDDGSAYVFIIDEINRGNLSKIFGELLMLIEADKRGADFAMPLTYSRDNHQRFSVPENVHIIGMMNTADRSLAMVDYALRRRFTFVDLVPQFASIRFREFLKTSVDSELIDRIIDRFTRLNQIISDDTTNLGPGFVIGHSFFCPQETEEDLGPEWYAAVVRSEIAPLLREYWFDSPDKAEEQIERLLR